MLADILFDAGWHRYQKNIEIRNALREKDSGACTKHLKAKKKKEKKKKTHQDMLVTQVILPPNLAKRQYKYIFRIPKKT